MGLPYIQSVIESVWDVVGPVISKIGSGIEKLAGVVKGIRGGGGDSGGTAPAGGGVAANATGTSFSPAAGQPLASMGRS